MTKSDTAALRCQNIEVSVDGKTIVKGVDLEIRSGEVHALMGPNGSGKSTLVNALAGRPGYEVRGEMWLNGESMGDLSPDQRARCGLFLGFQYPVAVPGVSVGTLMRVATSARSETPMKAAAFSKALKAAFEELSIPWAFASRYINDGFSGGEKKRFEVLQMLMLSPKVALLDEIDSGLDIDALKVASKGIIQTAKNNAGVLLVTHYQRLLDYVKPDFVHVFVDGRIVRSGGPEQAIELENRGYEWLEPNVHNPSARAAMGG